jgi:hypothetical protein
MERKVDTALQAALEKYTADINPMNLVIGTDKEYEHEIKLFLSTVDDSMGEDQLVDTIKNIFKEMFNVIHDDDFQEKYRELVREYLRLKKGYHHNI